MDLIPLHQLYPLKGMGSCQKVNEEPEEERAKEAHEIPVPDDGQDLLFRDDFSCEPGDPGFWDDFSCEPGDPGFGRSVLRMVPKLVLVGILMCLFVMSPK